MGSNTSAIARALYCTSLVCVALVVIAGPLMGGATRPAETWLLIAVAFAALGLALAARALDGGIGATASGRARPVRLRIFAILAVAFLAFVALCIVEAPAPLVRLISPAAAAAHADAVADVDGMESALSIKIAARGATISRAPARTFAALAVFAGGVCIFFAMILAATTRARIIFIAVALVSTGAMQAGIALVEAFITRTDIQGSYPNRNYLAGLLEMVAPLAVGLMIDRRMEFRKDMSARERAMAQIAETTKSTWKVGLFALYLLMGGVVFLSRSRMGVLCFGIGFMALLAFAARERSASWQKRAFIAVAAVALVILLASVFLRDHPTIARFSLLVSGQDVGASSRVEVWKDGLAIFAAHPIAGTGLGTFGEVHPTVQTPAFQAPHFEYAHNDWLNLATDTGVIGVGIIGFGLIVWLRAIMRRREDLRTYQKGLLCGVIAGVLAMLVHSLVDFNLQVPANAYVFATLLGAGLAAIAIDEGPRGRTQRREI